MKYRTLGRTGCPVSEIGFGAWGIGREMWVGAQDPESIKALHQAIDRGLTFIDTAFAYGQGHSERLVAQVLRERSERVYVATKVPPKNRRWPAQGPIAEVFPPDYIREYAEISLGNLAVDTIDLLQLHVWDPSWIEEDGWYQALEQLRDEGKIAHFGVSINDHQPDSALGLVESGRVDTVQVIYNIYDQSAEERLFPLCLEKEVGVIARVPFDEGALTGKITAETTFGKKDWRRIYFREDRKQQVEKRARALSALLEEGEDLPSLALKFCLHHPAVSTVIPGMRSVEHVEANLAVSGQPPLAEGRVEQLRTHGWPKNFYKQGA